MKHAVVVAHPRLRSLSVAIAEAYAAEASSLGHEVIMRNLYAMDFDPRLKASEIPNTKGYAPAPDVAAERALLEDVKVFAFVYPLWFNAPPAILKGYVDRVFSAGFGFDADSVGAQARLLGRELISFSTSGAPDHWVRETGALQSLTGVFDRHLAGVTGLSVTDHVHFGGIVGEITEEAFADIQVEVRAAVRRFFGGPGAQAAGLRKTT